MTGEMTPGERITYARSRSNMLLVGSEPRVDAVISAVTGLPAQALPEWADPDDEQVLAEPGGVPQTVLVRNVQALTAAQQQRLFEAIGVWQGRVRVIATAPAPVYPLVSSQLFNERLYYRLNMLCLDPMAVEV